MTKRIFASTTVSTPQNQAPKKETGKGPADKTLRFIGEENGLSVYLREIGKTRNLSLKDEAILQSLAEQSRIINIPLNRVGTIHRVGKTAVKMEQELCRAPSSGEISERLSLKEKDLNECLQLSSGTLSLEAPLQSDEDGQLSDVLRDENVESPDAGVTRMGLRKEVESVLATLESREAEVVKLYFGVGVNTCYTLEEIGHRFNLTRERVRQIKEKALKRLRHISRMRKLEVYSAA